MMPSAERPATRILFIGNSYTSRNQLPRLLARLAAAAVDPLSVEVEAIVAGGASLRRHWNGGAAHRALAAPWDYVVLQEQSTLPVKNPIRYHENVRLFAAEIALRGARAVLYLVWARQQALQTQEQLTRAAEAIAAEVGARLVPVGPVWQTALQQDRHLALYAADGSHPTPAGSYLAACVFLVHLFDRAPSGWSVSDSLKIDRGVAASLHALALASRLP